MAFPLPPPRYSSLFLADASESDSPAGEPAARTDTLAARLTEAVGTPEELPLALELLCATAEMLADAVPRSRIPRGIDRLIDPSVVDALTRLLIEQCTGDVVTDYVDLLRLMVKCQALTPEAVLAALSRPPASADRPPLLLQLATAGRWAIGRGDAVAALVIALAPKLKVSRSGFTRGSLTEGELARSAFRRDLLALTSPHGLLVDDKYQDFFGRLARDGLLLEHRTPGRNPRGALTCLEQLWMHDLAPTHAEVRSHHSARRADKLELAFSCARKMLDARHDRPSPDRPQDAVALATRLARQLRLLAPSA